MDGLKHRRRITIRCKVFGHKPEQNKTDDYHHRWQVQWGTATIETGEPDGEELDLSRGWHPPFLVVLRTGHRTWSDGSATPMRVVR
jgi:hypothetical protein